MKHIPEREAVVARQDRVLRRAALIVRIRDFRIRMSQKLAEAHHLPKEQDDG